MVRNSAVRSLQPPPGDLAGALCRVEGEGACGELMPYISGGIQGNLERDSGEMDQQSDLVERLTHSSSPGSSPTTKQGEDRVRVSLVHRPFFCGGGKNGLVYTLLAHARYSHKHLGIRARLHITATFERNLPLYSRILRHVGHWLGMVNKLSMVR